VEGRSVRDFIDTAPFLEWFEGQVDQRFRAESAYGLSTDQQARSEATNWMRGRIGWNDEAGERRLFRYRSGESTQAERNLIEDALEHADVRLEDIYPDLVEDIELEPDAYCGRCHEIVTPVSGVCPWCDTATTSADDVKPRAYCPTENKSVIPNERGQCWTCGTQTTEIPWVECACGCGGQRHAFDPKGRPAEYLLGHAPRTLENAGDMPAGPFRDYLFEQIRTIDVVSAVARRHGLPRDTVVQLLQGQERIERETIRRSLWVAGRDGMGKGMPMRADTVSFFDLYPEDARSMVCPGCGESKSRHANQCKACKELDEKLNGPKPRFRRKSALACRPDLMDRARVMYDAGDTMISIARRLLDETPYRSAESLNVQLRKEFLMSGWLRTQQQPEQEVAA